MVYKVGYGALPDKGRRGLSLDRARGQLGRLGNKGDWAEKLVRHQVPMYPTPSYLWIATR